MQTPGTNMETPPPLNAAASARVQDGVRFGSLAKALWANCIVLVAILLVLLSRNGGSSLPALSAAAYGQQMPIGGGAGVFIVPGQFSDRTWGCYLMDVDAETLCAYQYFGGDKQLRLVASRYFRFDRRLKNFNSPNPSPDEVSQLVAREADDARVKQQNNVPLSPETPAKNQ
jgi:hypothetical protein